MLDKLTEDINKIVKRKWHYYAGRYHRPRPTDYMDPLPFNVCWDGQYCQNKKNCRECSKTK